MDAADKISERSSGMNGSFRAKKNNVQSTVHFQNEAMVESTEPLSRTRLDHLPRHVVKASLSPSQAGNTQVNAATDMLPQIHKSQEPRATFPKT